MKQIVIRKGDEFVCIKKVVMMLLDKTTEYRKGFIYISEKDNCITNESGDKNHHWNFKANSKYFVKIKY
jgi:hypothetical protein